jgi:hypothetical protein
MVGGNGATVVDLDVLDHDAAALARTIADEELGITPLQVTGLAPKVKLVFRGGVATGKTANPYGLCLEIFHGLPSSTNGQTVLFGIHPDTGQPYSWAGESPLTFRLDDLPPISAAGLDRLVQRMAAASKDCPALLADIGLRGSGAGSAVDASVAATIKRELANVAPQHVLTAAADILRRMQPGGRHSALLTVVRLLMVERMLDPVSIFDALCLTWLEIAGEPRGIELDRALEWAGRIRPPATSITFYRSSRAKRNPL